MPFTPFHFGPGLLIKGAIPTHFSLSTFALANVAMDVEPLYHLLHGDHQLHGVSHSLLGAVIIGAGSALCGDTVLRHASRLYEHLSANSDMPFHITSRQAWIGALLGTSSHVLMDAAMHADVHPFLPFTDSNPWLDVSFTWHIYLNCLLAGMAGLLLLFFRTGFIPKHSQNR